MVSLGRMLFDDDSVKLFLHGTSLHEIHSSSVSLTYSCPNLAVGNFGALFICVFRCYITTMSLSSHTLNELNLC